MEKGEFMILGASTDHEFHNAFDKDPAFIDRFDLVRTKTKSKEEIAEILRSRMIRIFPAGVDILVLNEAIDLSDSLDVTTEQPRAAVNLLKKAIAMLEGRGVEDRPPTSAELKEAAVKKYGVDPARFSREVARTRLSGLASHLEERVIGQTDAKAAVTSVWKRKLTGVGDPERVNSVLLYGPPGTGKTRTAIESTTAMGYDYTVIEMNKYAHASGIDEFRRAVYAELSKNPFRVLIFDEIEKAAIEVQDSALSMMQTGFFTVKEDAIGGGTVMRDVKARHAVFILTSNAAGEAGGQLTGDALIEALLKGGISAPLLSRIESKQYLRRPTREEFRQAIGMYLDITLKRESAQLKSSVRIADRERFLNEMSERYTAKSDYRDVNKLVASEVEEIISDAVLHQAFVEGATIELHWKIPEGRLGFTIRCPELMMSH